MNRILHQWSGIRGWREFIQVCARFLLLGMLVYAPWAFGSTRPDLVAILDEGLLACLGLHVLGLVVEWRLPRYPLVPTVCLGLLLLEGCWMYFNAQSLLDDSYWEFVPLAQSFPGLPGSWDKLASLGALTTFCAMSGAFLVASDLMSNAVWKARLWRTIAIIGCSVIIYGLVVKGFGNDWAFSMFNGRQVDPTFFGPYRYHANAGAYLNLIWPVLLALYVRSSRDRDAHGRQTLWICALVLGVAACFVNTSKASAVITALLLGLALLGFAPFFWEKLTRASKVSRVLAILFVIGFLAIVVYGGLASQLVDRWSHMIDTGDAMGETKSRLTVDKACLRMIPDAGWFGFGQGTFVSVFPFHTAYLGDQIRGYWIYAHEDYLQTVIEYGYLGTALWSVLYFGSVARAIYCGLQPSLRTHDRLVYRATGLALIGLACHSLVDFPMQVASIQLYVAMFFAYAWSRPDASRKV